MTYKVEYIAVTTNVDVIYVSYPAQTHTITELMKGTSYSVRVALNNSAGEGEYSSSEIGRTAVDRECLNVVCSHVAFLSFVLQTIYSLVTINTYLLVIPMQIFIRQYW